MAAYHREHYCEEDNQTLSQEIVTFFDNDPADPLSRLNGIKQLLRCVAKRVKAYIAYEDNDYAHFYQIEILIGLINILTEHYASTITNIAYFGDYHVSVDDHVLKAAEAVNGDDVLGVISGFNAYYTNTVLQFRGKFAPVVSSRNKRNQNPLELTTEEITEVTDMVNYIPIIKRTIAKPDNYLKEEAAMLDRNQVLYTLRMNNISIYVRVFVKKDGGVLSPQNEQTINCIQNPYLTGDTEFEAIATLVGYLFPNSWSKKIKSWVRTALKKKLTSYLSHNVYASPLWYEISPLHKEVYVLVACCPILLGDPVHLNSEVNKLVQEAERDKIALLSQKAQKRIKDAYDDLATVEYESKYINIARAINALKLILLDWLNREPKAFKKIKVFLDLCLDATINEQTIDLIESFFTKHNLDGKEFIIGNLKMVLGVVPSSLEEYQKLIYFGDVSQYSDSSDRN